MAIDHLPKDLKPYIIHESLVQELNFPVERYPEKVKSLNLAKKKVTKGCLKGLKDSTLYLKTTLYLM